MRSLPAAGQSTDYDRSSVPLTTGGNASGSATHHPTLLRMAARALVLGVWMTTASAAASSSSRQTCGAFVGRAACRTGMPQRGTSSRPTTLVPSLLYFHSTPDRSSHAADDGSSDGRRGREGRPVPTLSWSLQLSSRPTALFSSAPNKEEVDPGAVMGTDLRIVKYPHPALRAPNAEITPEELERPTTGDGPSGVSERDDITRLARGMLKIMYAAEGVGLAAPQVGVNKRLMVYNPTGDPQKWMEETILVNPRIVESSAATDVEVEGCLSFPGMNGEVERSKWIKVEAMNLRGKKIKKKYTGWEARIFQHEYDHLDGTVYIDRLSDETRAKVQPRLDELIAEFGEGGAL